MTGQGPKLDGPQPVSEDTAAAARLAAQFYRDGQASVTRGGYQAGADLGHDVGYGARQDARQFVHGVMDGFARGTEARRELVSSLANHRLEGQPEKEAEAG
jgi:hypothetical protein